MRSPLEGREPGDRVDAVGLLPNAARGAVGIPGRVTEGLEQLSPGTSNLTRGVPRAQEKLQSGTKTEQDNSRRDEGQRG